MIPICSRNKGMKEKRETNFDYVAMVPFRGTIVFKSVWKGDEVRNAISGKKFFKGFVFPTITRIKSDDLSIEIFFDESFESKKNIVHMRFVLE